MPSEVETRHSSPDEIRKLMELAASYRAEAERAVSAAIRFHLAYEAGRLWCEVVVRAEGLRIKGVPGHHEEVIRLMGKFLGPPADAYAKRLDRARRTRNDLLYDADSSGITAKDARDLSDTVNALAKCVTTWLKEKHPDLANV